MHFDWVGPHYFSTMGIALVSGRDFTERDEVGSPAVIVINEEASRLFFAGTNPIGRHLLWGDGSEQPKVLEIIAVFREVKQSGPRDEPELRSTCRIFRCRTFEATGSRRARACSCGRP